MNATHVFFLTATIQPPKLGCWEWTPNRIDFFPKRQIRGFTMISAEVIILRCVFFSLHSKFWVAFPMCVRIKSVFISVPCPVCTCVFAVGANRWPFVQMGDHSGYPYRNMVTKLAIPRCSM